MIRRIWFAQVPANATINSNFSSSIPDLCAQLGNLICHFAISAPVEALGVKLRFLPASLAGRGLRVCILAGAIWRRPGACQRPRNYPNKQVSLSNSQFPDLSK